MVEVRAGQDVGDGMTEQGAHDRFDALMADISAEVAAAHLQDDIASARALADAEYATVELAARLRASERVCVDALGVGYISGLVKSVNAQVCVIASESTLGEQTWVVPLASVVTVEGLAKQARSASVVDARLGLTALLRQWCDEGRFTRCWLATTAPASGEQLRTPTMTGTLARVGRDHFDLWVHGVGESVSRGRPVTTVFVPQVRAICSP